MDAEPGTTKRALRSTAKTQPTTKPKEHAVQQGAPRRNYQQRWSEKERDRLLEALETYGPRELESIAEMVGTRSREEVMCAIKYWKKESANQSIKVTFNRKNFNKSGVGRMRNCKVVNGVELWIDVMLKHGGKTGGKEAILAIADVVKCIACFEALPTVEEADGIDFRELYLWLAEMVNGQPIRSLSLATSAFLTQCSRDLSKQAADNLWPRTKSALSRIVDNVWCPQNVKTYSKRDPPPVKNSFINERMQALLSTPGINPIGLDKERLPFKQLLG